VTLFQGARELLINAAKHAEAGRVVLRLAYDRGLLRVCVVDDGRGIDPQWLGPDAECTPMALEEGGFGLYSLRSRIELLGGQLSMGSVSPRGTEACLTIRLGEEAGDGIGC
jgi:signal transduction histidine kinase